jgi:hypothetical protein
MTVCKTCGTSLAGQHIVAYEDGPAEAGDPVPEDENHELYDTELGVIVCPGCDREIPFTPRQYHNPPEEL